MSQGSRIERLALPVGEADLRCPALLRVDAVESAAAVSFLAPFPVEREALLGGFSLMTLDAKRGEAAERLYQKLGWTVAGTIPRFALDPDGRTMHDAVVFYLLTKTRAGALARSNFRSTAPGS